MLEIGDGQMAAIAGSVRAGLRPLVLARWYGSLREVGDAVGADGRERVLAAIEALAREGGWETADLLILADVLLVGLLDDGDEP